METQQNSERKKKVLTPEQIKKLKEKTILKQNKVVKK